jgi:lysozyme
MRSKLNAGDIPGAAREFTRWCHAGGRVDEELLERRTAELVMFLGT